MKSGPTGTEATPYRVDSSGNITTTGNVNATGSITSTGVMGSNASISAPVFGFNNFTTTTTAPSAVAVIGLASDYTVRISTCTTQSSCWIRIGSQ